MLVNYNITQTTLKILRLYASDYKKSFHMREIARKTSVDVKTIQLQLQRLEKSNVVSSTRKGKNKEFSLKRDVITHYYMVMAECFVTAVFIQKNFLIKKILAELTSYVDGTLVLFGSYANGTFTKQSDIDLFIVGDKKIDTKIVLNLSDMINKDINIKYANKQQFLNNLSNNDPLAKEVVLKHIILKGADNFCQMMWENYVA